MKIAYVRVSTIEQNEARQIEALEKYGIEKWFTEKISAKDTNRVYTARTATRARSFCPPSPLAAHGHCPEKCDILDMARNA